ncbi:Tetratricopeptide repeat protein 38 [Strongyloides ratti]|uniref:Tetratricopeptide repeat protein 38 n=1 Tax=Strongyloides ratti TaxID=34506 RepID=A0A090MNR1_STRRB|nr:Tetratricopeptide repeat protein 38 [Strongyloides ratti]CEF59681.1 Tetratricopeptide repeat protein 38 [Strongyloides ratti]
MGEWCGKNLKDIQGWKEDGLENTITSNETAKLLDASIRQLVSLRDCDQLGGFVKTMTDMLHNEPNAVLPRIFVLAVDVLGTNKSWYINEDFKNKINKVINDTNKYGNKREKLHSNALKAMAIGCTMEALNIYECILAQYPKDLMAIKLSQQLYFFTGQPFLMNLSMNRIITKWSKDNIMYSYLLGMQAFGYEECGNYRIAENIGKEALSLRKEDAWATHALSHVYEMTKQYEKGIENLIETSSYWKPCWILECHNYWHLALFYIESEKYDEAITIYDKNIKSCLLKYNSILDACDASGLLQRLEFCNIHVGQKRWDDLTPFILPYTKGHMYSFNYPLMAIALGHSSNPKHLRNFVDLDIQYTPSNGETSFYINKVSIPIIHGIDEYFKCNYTKCFDYLYPIRYNIKNIGGSNAQKDIFTQFIINAGKKSTKSDYNEKVKIVLEERKLLYNIKNNYQ